MGKYWRLRGNDFRIFVTSITKTCYVYFAFLAKRNSNSSGTVIEIKRFVNEYENSLHDVELKGNVCHNIL